MKHYTNTDNPINFPTHEPEDYFALNPDIEIAYWTEWVRVVCDWEKLPRPTASEWILLRSKFYPSKAPAASVQELKEIRARNDNEIYKK